MLIGELVCREGNPEKTPSSIFRISDDTNDYPLVIRKMSNHDIDILKDIILKVDPDSNDNNIEITLLSNGGWTVTWLNMITGEMEISGVVSPKHDEESIYHHNMSKISVSMTHRELMDMVANCVVSKWFNKYL